MRNSIKQRGRDERGKCLLIIIIIIIMLMSCLTGFCTCSLILSVDVDVIVVISRNNVLFSILCVLHEWLLSKVSFRDAHEVSGKVVSRAEQLGCDVTKVPLRELQSIRYVVNNNEYISHFLRHSRRRPKYKWWRRCKERQFFLWFDAYNASLTYTLYTLSFLVSWLTDCYVTTTQ
jgi:hypothetical protein